MKFFLIWPLLCVSICLPIHAQSIEERKKAIEEEIELQQLEMQLDSIQRLRNTIKISLPCETEALDNDLDYITGFGIGEPAINPRSESEARKIAHSNATLEINRKWMGTINRVTEEYYKRTNEKEEERAKFAETLKVSGEKAIQNFTRIVCSQLVEKKEEKRTSLTCYIAIKVPVSEVVNTIVEDAKEKGHIVNKASVQESIKIGLNPINF